MCCYCCCCVCHALVWMHRAFWINRSYLSAKTFHCSVFGNTWLWGQLYCSLFYFPSTRGRTLSVAHASLELMLTLLPLLPPMSWDSWCEPLWWEEVGLSCTTVEANAAPYDSLASRHMFWEVQSDRLLIGDTKFGVYILQTRYLYFFF